MTPRIIQSIVLVVLMSYGHFCCANSAISMAFGHGTKKVHANRIAWQNSWFNDASTAHNRKYNGYWELAFTRLKGTQEFSYPTNKSLDISTVSAVLRIHKDLILSLYLDLGIGVAYLSKENIASRELGSHCLFEDRLGFGVLLGRRKQVEIGYRAVHYSNAYLAKKNHGLNLHLLIIGYWLH